MSQFMIVDNEIVGLKWDMHRKRWKNCLWCNTTFLPHHNKQKYCSKLCRTLQRRAYKSRWQLHRRYQEQNGVIINDRNILNVGTGRLGEHRCNNFRKEENSIRKELKELGLR